MPGRLTIIGRLTAAERLAIGLLRDDQRYRADRGLAREFRALRREVQHAGLTLPAAESPYLGADEVTILAWLTLLQRQNEGCPFDAGAALRDALLRCAVRLDSHGARLHQRNLTRSRLGERPLRLASVPPEPSDAGVRRKAALPRDLADATLQARTLRFVRERGIACTSEIRRFGASRQMIHLMFKRGLLMRVRHAAYSAAPEALALLAPAR